jgi:alpha-tubulin suppressor-like RCC1 family protein
LQWTPIDGFSGTFDGAGNVISNLYISSVDDYQALFGHIDGASIENLNLANAVIEGGSYTSSLVAVASSSTITNCHANASINAGGSGADITHVGGIIGDVHNQSIINSCSFSGSVYSTGLFTGGIAGGLLDSGILNSSNSGHIESSGYGDTGGIVGSFSNNSASISIAKIEACINKGIVNGTGSTGGIVGYAETSGNATSGMIRSCNQGEVTGADYVGGLIGKTDAFMAVSYCYNIGDVNGANYIGGLIGRFNQNINYANGISLSYNAGVVNGSGSYKGGLIGYNFGVIGTNYYKSGIAALGYNGSNTGNGNTYALSDSDLKSNAGVLGSNYADDSENVNSGYPILVSVDYNDYLIPNNDPSAKTGFFSYASGANDYQAVYHYSDEYFAESSKVFNIHLATMTLCLEMSAFGSGIETNMYDNYSLNAEALLTEELGFEHFETSPEYNFKPYRDSIGCVAAYKTLSLEGQDYTLIALAVRGSGYEAEWASNFKMGESGLHQGFMEARDKVLEFLDDYISDNGITGDIKLWLTGYSRAAATANMVGGSIDDDMVNGMRQFENASLKDDDLYCYTFETPMGALQSQNPRDDKYGNIFNVINVNDIVTRVAPEVDGFNFGRYGRDITLPDRVIFEQEGYTGFDTLETAMINKLEAMEHVSEYKVKNFKMSSLFASNANDPKPQYDFLNEVTRTLFSDFFENRSKYVSDYQQSITDLLDLYFGGNEYQRNIFEAHLVVSLLSFSRLDIQTYLAFGGRELLCQLIETELAIGMTMAGYTNYLEYQANGTFASLADLLVSFLIDDLNVIATLVENVGGIGQAHYADLCFAWLQSMDSNYTPGASVIFAKTPDYRELIVKCPVDVYVYNDMGTLVAAVIGDEPQCIGSIAAGVEENGAKVVYLPAASEYTVEIAATGDGTMNYSVREFSYQAGQKNRLQNYYDIPITTGQVFVGTFPAYSENDIAYGTIGGSSAEYYLEDETSGTTIMPDDTLSGTEAIEAYFTVSAETEDINKGAALGSGRRQLGSYANIIATPAEEYAFEGWYDSSDNKVSSESKYSFRVMSDVTLTAKFVVGSAAPIIIDQPASVNVDVDGDAVLSVSAESTDDGELSYQWYTNTTADTDGASPISGAVSSTFSAPTSAAGIAYYYAAVTNTLSSAGNNYTATTLSDIISVTVTESADISTIKVVGGGYHTLALKSDGTVWAWGNNYYYQLGNGTTVDSIVPEQISGLTDVVDIASGWFCGMALKSDGTVWVWGDNVMTGNNYGSTPTQIQSLSDVTAIAAGSYHNLALKADGTLMTWGHNAYGQLGTGSTNSYRLPTQILGISGVAAIAARGNFSLALKSDGTVLSWGANEYNQLGDGTTTNKTVPAQVSGLSGITKIAAGKNHGVAIDDSGSVWVWGHNNFGQLGNGTAVNISTPVQATWFGEVSSITAGGYHTIALKTDGTLWGCGYNLKGQTGDGTTVSKQVPTQITSLGNIIAIGAGEGFTIVVNSLGSVYTFGENNYGQLGNNSTVNSPFPIFIGLNLLGNFVSAAAPVITLQPTSESAFVNETVELSVSAVSTDNGELSYQWYTNTAADTNGASPISGAVSSIFDVPTDLTGVQYYFVVVKNTLISATGSTVETTTSNIVSITIVSPTTASSPVISGQVTGSNAMLGYSALLFVSASVTDGGNLTYQWYMNTTASTTGGTAISGEVDSIYIAPGNVIGTFYYYAVVTNTIGSSSASVTSDLITVNRW